MILYYTGPCYNKASSSDKSLGGFLSTSSVPSNILGSLFRSFSYSDRNKSQCKGVILKNTTGNLLTTLTIKVIPPLNTNLKLQVAIVYPTINSSGVYIEQIPNIYALPLTGNFTDFESPISLGNFANNSYLGFWFKLNRITDLFSSDLCLVNLPQDLEETFQIKFEWN